MNEDNLKPCPFCGNDNFSRHTMDPVSVMENERRTYGYGFPCETYMEYFVKCHKCFATGGKCFSGYPQLSQKTLTPEEARSQAISNWNRRPS